MSLIIKTIAILFMSVGALCLFSPVTIKDLFRRMQTGKLPGMAVAVNLALGAFLLRATEYCLIKWIPFFIGIICIMKAMILLVYGPKRFIIKVSAWLANKNSLIRLSSIACIVFGIMLFVAV